MFKVKCLILMMAAALLVSVRADAKEVQPIFGLSKFISNEADELLYQSWTKIQMSGETSKMYPNLSKALDKYNAEEHDKAMERQRKYHEEALTLKQEMPPDAFRQFYDKGDLIVRRADSAVLSLLEMSEDYLGGVHGMYGCFGVNFDAATGRRLQISDVCTDAEALVKAILTRLHEDAPMSPFENAEMYIMEQVVQDTLNFTIEPAGISVYFNPYEIGSYAEGLFTATILFSEYPALFKDKYKQLPQAYCETLTLHYPNIVSFTPGMRNYVQVNLDDNGNYNVGCGGGTAEDMTGLQGLQPPVLVHMANGSCYLYIDGYIDNVGRSLHVYAISDSKLELVWVLPCTFKDMGGMKKYETWWIPTDPGNIRFYSLEAIEEGGTPMNRQGIIKSDGSFSFG